jgi:cation transport ATPase
VGVDVIALVAVSGAIAVGELLAAAVIAVMLASGRALEAWAAGRACRDLQELLQRAPRVARRYQGDLVETVPLDAVAPGDLLMVAPGDLVPADGILASAAVLDESALTAEALPVERAPGEPVRSGVLNTGGPFDLRVTAAAADSTYAGVVSLVSQAETSQPPFVRLADRYGARFLAFTLAVAGAVWAAAGPAREVTAIIPAGPHDPAGVLRWRHHSTRCPGMSWPPRWSRRPPSAACRCPCRLRCGRCQGTGSAGSLRARTLPWAKRPGPE